MWGLHNDQSYIFYCISQRSVYGVVASRRCYALYTLLGLALIQDMMQELKHYHRGTLQLY